MGTMVEQLCLNGFTLYKYICNKKNKKQIVHLNWLIDIHWQHSSWEPYHMYKISTMG